MFEDIETHKKLSKWIIGTFTACILIYLGIRHISHVADAVMWLKDLLNPLLIGLILALFLNVPLGVIERHLFPKHPTSRKTKMRRPLAILLSFILVIGVFVGVAFLVIPELILSRLVDTFFSRISLTMPPAPKSHNTAYVLPWEEPLHWQSRSSGYSSS